MWRYLHVTLFSLMLIYLGVNLAKTISINTNNLYAYDYILSSQQTDISHVGLTSSYLLGLEQFHRGKFEAAARFFEQSNPDRKTLSRWFYIQAKGNTTEWDQALDAVDFKSSEDKILFASILYYHRAQLLPGELEKREKIIRQNPEMIIVYANLFLSSNQFDQAIDWIELLPNPEQSIPAQMILGRAYFYSGKLVEAERVFQNLQQVSASPDVEFWYGKVLFFLGKKDEGISLMENGMLNSNGRTKTLYLLDLIDAYLRVNNCSGVQKNITLAIKLDAKSENLSTIKALKEKYTNLCP